MSPIPESKGPQKSHQGKECWGQWWLWKLSMRTSAWRYPSVSELKSHTDPDTRSLVDSRDRGR